MDESKIFEGFRRGDQWALHMVGHLAAHESAAVRVALIEAIESSGGQWQLPTAVVELLAELLDDDLQDDNPF